MENKYKKIVLKNGARLILVPDASKDVVTSIVLFGVGSRYESEKEAGISHVLEHMFFKGTKKRPTTIELAEYVESFGGENNAFTSKEYTGYYVKSAAKYLDKAIDFLSDLVINPLFPADELEREKGVIIQEINMYQDRPQEVAGIKFETALFGDNSLGRETIGYKETVQSTTKADLIDYRTKYYNGQNTVIVLAGNLSLVGDKEVARMVESSFIFPNKKTAAFSEVELPKGKQIFLDARKTEQSHIVIGFRGVSYSDPDRQALRLLALILGGSMSSRMFINIRERKGLAYAVRTNADNFLDTGAFETYAGVEHDRAEEAIAAILAEYRRIKEDLSPDELAKAKEIIYGRMLINMEDTNELAHLYAEGELMEGKILTPAEILKIYQDLTLEDLKRVANKYLVEETMAISFVGPNLSREKLAEIFVL